MKRNRSNKIADHNRRRKSISDPEIMFMGCFVDKIQKFSKIAELVGILKE